MYSQALVGPLIRPGVAGLLRTILKLLDPLLPQSFTAITEILLVVNPGAKVTDTVVSFTPGPLMLVMFVVPAWADQI
jgi:hypothetical protein